MDFPVPSPKRQRTESPPPPQIPDVPQENHSTPNRTLLPEQASTVTHTDSESVVTKTQTQQEPAEPTQMKQEDNSILDALMQHVEAESGPPAQTGVNHTLPDEIAETKETPAEDTKIAPSIPFNASTEDTGSIHHQPQPETTHVKEDVEMEEAVTETSKAATEAENSNVKSEEIQTEMSADALPPGIPAASDETVARLRAAAEVDGIPPTSDVLAEQADEPQGREWETDSSPYESSDSDSSDSSDDDSDDDDDDAEGDYAMLDAEEQARILMQDGGSDDEGERGTNRGQGAGLRTANEKVEEIIPKPDITVTENMRVEELGSVEAVIEGIVLVKAKISGEYQVLESGSLLCLKDRTVLGVVGETLGRVEQPLYTLRFTNNEAVHEAGVSEKGTAIYYVHEHSTFVFTQPLKAVKGSDASNFHDEEVGDEEMEFSDDEAEAEHKRQLKLKRRGVNPDTARGRGAGRGGRGNQRGRGGYPQHPQDSNGTAYGNGSLEMNYDEPEAGEEGYTPLSRPSNLHEMMGSSQPTESTSGRPPHLPPFPPMNRDRGRGRGRGGNDRGRGHRGGQRGGRGGPASGHNNNSNNYGNSSNQQQYSNQYNMQQTYPQNSYTSPMGSGAPPQFSFLPPPPPNLTPQNNNYATPFSPSPISPLPPQQHYGFMGGYPGDPKQQQNYQPPMLGNHFPPQFFGSAQQQQQQNGFGGNNLPAAPPAWQTNQAAAAQVQRQLEEMRRTMGNGNGGAGQ